ncbi:MAG: sulfite exporter TauE/SafE family protein [Promethearchaeota archaeon]
MEFIYYILILLITGIAVGFVSGGIGVGGCFIMVPVQYWLLISLGVDPTIAIRVAFGTNLMVVIPTAASGAYAHSKKDAVIWNKAILLGCFGAIGVFLGALIAVNTPGSILTIIFGAVILAGAIRMLTAKPIKVDEEISENTLSYALWGILIGFCSGLIGIGGGVIMIPILILALHFKMHNAVGTSTAVMIFTASVGAICYILLGLHVTGLPPFSIGYVNLLQWILLAGTSVPMAIIGAKVAHKLPAKKLKLIFIIIMVYMGLKMIGVFGWLGLPI